jgi:hypothetical protein
VARDEIAAATDAEIVADLLAGPIFYRHLVARGRLDTRYADRVVDAVLGSLRRGTPAGATPAVLA